MAPTNKSTPQSTHAELRDHLVVRDRSGHGAVHTTRDLATMLQSRLHFLARWALWIWTLFALFDVGLFWQTILHRPSQLFTVPPLLGFMPLVMAAFATVARATRPTVQPTLTRLRSLELLLFASGSIWVAAMWVRQLQIIGPRFASLAMLLAIASAGFWVIAMFAYGVLIPNDWRRCAQAMVALSSLAVLPDIMTLLMLSVGGRAMLLYVGLKLLTLGGVAALATFGAYRIDVLEADVRDARQLGQYTLHERLGGGGMGEVYRASHRLLRRPCAVKLIRADLEGGNELAARFEREVQATATLTHPNTVQVYDYGHADDGTFYYVMEYLPGQSLEDLVTSEGPLTPARAVHLLAQVCDALHEAHLNGLVHRDIKPANILVTRRHGTDDVAKVLDFGLVTPVQAGNDDTRMTQAGLLLGTPAFMSPEQCGGEPVGPAADLYALGAVAWFCLRGEPLFAGRNMMQLLAAHLTEVPPPLSTSDRPASLALEGVIRRCLAKSPDDRFSSAASLAEALRAAV